MTCDPGMYEEIVDTWSLLLILNQTLTDKVDAVLCAILEDLLLKLWLFIQDGIVEDQTLIGACELESSISSQHLVGQDTQCKYICFRCD